MQNKQAWQTKKLGEVCDIVNGGTPKTKIAKYWEGDILWITPRDMGGIETIYTNNTLRKITQKGLDNSSAKLIPENSVILSTRAPIGHLAINTEKMSFNQGCKGIVPGLKMDNKFLYYFLSKSIELLNELGSGTTFKELSSGSLSDIKIPVPLLAGQKRIVKILDEVFADIEEARENAEKNLENAKELFESYLESIFSNNEKLKNKNKEWEEKELGEVCEKTSNIKWQDFKVEKFKYVDLSAVSRDNLKIESSVLVNYENAPSRARKIIKSKDIIFATTRPTLKRIAKVYDDFNNQICSTGFTVLRANKNKILFEIIYYFLQTGIFMDAMEKLQRGASYPAVSDTDVKNQVLKFPKSLKTQKQIVKKLDELSGEVGEYEAILRNKIADLDELKKSVLEKAFEGKL